MAEEIFLIKPLEKSPPANSVIPIPVITSKKPLPRVSQILRYVLWMWLPHWAFALMPLTLVLLTRSTTLGIILSLVAGSGLTVALMATLGRLLRWPPLEQYFLAAVVKGVYTPESGLAPIGIILVCAAAWATVYGIGSLLTMEMRDI